MFGFGLSLSSRKRGVGVDKFLATNPLLYANVFKPIASSFFDVRETNEANPVYAYMRPTQAICANVEIGDTIQLPNFVYSSWTKEGTCDFTINDRMLTVTAPGTLYNITLYAPGIIIEFPVCEGAGDKLWGYNTWGALYFASITSSDLSRFWNARQNTFYHGLQHGQTIGVQNFCRNSTLIGGAMTFRANANEAYEGNGEWSADVNPIDDFTVYGFNFQSIFPFSLNNECYFSIDVKAAKGQEGFVAIDDSSGWSGLVLPYNPIIHVTDQWARYTIKFKVNGDSKVPAGALRCPPQSYIAVPRIHFRRPQIYTQQDARYSDTRNPQNVGVPYGGLVNIAANPYNYNEDCVGNPLTALPGFNRSAKYVFSSALADALSPTYFEADGTPIPKTIEELAADATGKVYIGKNGIAVYETPPTGDTLKTIKRFIGSS